MTIGYTTGVFDLFHIGHLNLLKNAKGLCDKLIVGVTTDELVSYKGKKAVIPFEERLEIVRNIQYVDAVIPMTSDESCMMTYSSASTAPDASSALCCDSSRAATSTTAHG